MNKIKIIKFIFILNFIFLTLAIQINISNLESFWKIKGNGFIISNSMNLIIKKLNNQKSIFSSVKKLKSDKDWKISCKILNSDKKINSFLSILLTDKYIFDSFDDYIKTDISYKQINLESINAFNLIINGGISESYFINNKSIQNEIYSQYLKCKTDFNNTNYLFILIEKVNDKINYYFKSHKDDQYNFCNSYSVKSILNNFYFNIISESSENDTQIEISNLLFETDYKGYEIVENKENAINEDELKYFVDANSNITLENKASLINVFIENHNKSKNIAKQMFKLLSMNFEETESNLQKSIKNISTLMFESLKQIENHAKSIDRINLIIQEDKINGEEGISDFLDQVLRWMDQIDNIFNQINNDTLDVENKVKNINFESRLKKLNTNITNIHNQLSSLKNYSDSLNILSSNTNLEDNLNKFQTNINNEFNSTKMKIKEKSSKKSSFYLKIISNFLIISICLLIIVITIIVCRMKKAIHNKRVY